MLCGKLTVTAAMVLGLASGAAAQGNPTGAVRGQVVDPDNLPVPGVTVTARSQAVQGSRTALTSSNGDFIIPFLPPGDYSVGFELAGFQPQTRTIVVAIGETLPMKIELALAGMIATVMVRGTSSSEIPRTVTLAETYKAASLERLPVGRTLDDAVLLAPGVAPNGPLGHIVMSGALSYENLFLINGVVVNDFIKWGEAPPLYVEDALQETTISTAKISAEYGRFQGGVVNVITKSGGNAFTGSFRTSFTNDAWRALTPYVGDQTINSLTPTFEFTGGGPIRENKAWFFGAGQFTSPLQNMTLDVTRVNYTLGTDDRRGEGKLTYAVNPRNTVTASYTRRALAISNDSLPNSKVMDLASLYDDRTDFSLSVVNYTSVLKEHVFFEGQFSRKRQAMTGSGSRFSDLVKGTPITDRSRTTMFNSPGRCNVCGGGWLDQRDNSDWFVKLGYFLSTGSVGSHSFVAGFDNYKEMRRNNNWASGSGYVIQATTTMIDGSTVYPVFKNDNSTYVNYQPLVADSLGNHVQTSSAFVNDAWRYNGHLSLNLGYRYDQNRSKDQSGVPVVNEWSFSPRLGLTWDFKADGRWQANAGFARYVMAMSNLVADAGSAGGRTANYSYFYQGPDINTGSDPYITADRALPILFDWFFANGGRDRATRNAPTIPGLTRKIGDMTAPNSHEYSIGVSRNFEHGGAWRVDYIHRNYRDLYGDSLDTTTGRVTDRGTGRQYDFTVVKNNPDAKRTYNGLAVSASYRRALLQVGGNYTLSWSRGNVDGEGISTEFFRTMIGTYPEYRQASWNSPIGYTMNDQRHKVRAWFSYFVPIAERFGQMNLGILQRFDSALPYDAVGSIDSRQFVVNPGYITPPSTVVYYFSPRMGLRWDNASAADVSLNWSKRIPSFRTTEVFFRGVITNIFNNSAVVSGDSTVLTAASPGSAKGLQGFNPFTDKPVLGVNWMYGPTFGQPIGTDDYQTPRTFSCSVGVRF